MQKQQILKLIAKYARLELDEITTIEIAKETSEFDVFEFLEFVKDNLDNYELKYTPNGIERFLKFCKMYKKSINVGREAKAQSESQRLEEKFRSIKFILVEEFHKGKRPKLECLQSDGENYFDNFEIKTLNAIGSVGYLIRLDNSFKLQSEIEKHFLKIIHKKTVQRLEVQRKLNTSVKKF